jgi:hypothetical protein
LLLKNSPDIIWGLIYAASKYSYHHDILNWYFLITPGLEKILRNGGLDMRVIGESIDHKGLRYPFKMDALATYQSDMWQSYYKQGYRKFSECNIADTECDFSFKNKAPTTSQNNITYPNSI